MIASLELETMTLQFRPSYAALVAAEDELGPFFAFVEQASAGQLKLAEIVTMLWHCRWNAPPSLVRSSFAEACVAAGLARVTPVFRRVMEQALGGV